MTIPLKTARPVFWTIFLFGLCGWVAALFSVNQMQVVDVEYRLAIEQQVNAAFVLANANHLLVAERDDLAEMLIDNTASGSAADLAQLNSDETGFNQAMMAAGSLAPGHAAQILALRARANQLLNGNCKKAIALGNAATASGPILASQDQYLSQCAPYFPGLVSDMYVMQNRLRNERNAQIARLKAANGAHIRTLFHAVLAGLLVMLVVVVLSSRFWLAATANDGLAQGRKKELLF
jgi:hypothetical protein